MSSEKAVGLAAGRDRSQSALAYVLAHPAVSTTVPGAKRPSEVEDNVAASAHPLSEEELARTRGVLARFAIASGE